MLVGLRRASLDVQPKMDRDAICSREPLFGRTSMCAAVLFELLEGSGCVI
jgi:hypothetical protein